MRTGLRLRILLALGALLVLAFVPLYWAVSGLTRASLVRARESAARSLGRAVAGHVAMAEKVRGREGLEPLLEAQQSPEGVAAIGVYGPGGERLAEVGESASALPATLAVARESSTAVTTSHGAALLVAVPMGDDDGSDPNTSEGGAVAVVVRTDPATVSTGPLVRLFALYSAGLASALLVFGYVALGWLVVRPVDALSRAARRVSEGARSLEPPSTRTRELAELGVSLRTMTERLRAEEEALVAKVAEVERAAADLREAQARLVRSERLASVGRLSAGLAHELGNPLAAIVGLVDLLESGGLDADEQRDFLARVRRETERMHGVLRGLLDFARPAAPRAEGAPVERGSVPDAVGEVRGLLAPQRDFRELSLELELDDELPKVRLSTSELTQVLLNLVLNARDAVMSVAPTSRPSPGRVRITAKAHGAPGEHGASQAAEPVDHAERTEHAHVELMVDDDGPGLAPELASTLFEPFVTTKEVGKGTGLGLAVCRGLIEAAGGTIEARPSPLGGARFVVRLPTAV